MVARSRTTLAGAPVLVALLLTACSSASAGNTAPGYGSTPPVAATTAAATASGSGSTGARAADAATLTLAITSSSLGPILVDGRGMTLYLYTKDSPNTSVCTGQCLIAWPPLLGKPTAGAGVDAARLGSFQRADGSTQASYNGWPLYYWKADVKPGDVTGQNVNSVWYVLGADGNAIKN